MFTCQDGKDGDLSNQTLEMLNSTPSVVNIVSNSYFHLWKLYLSLILVVQRDIYKQC